jgi:hypothetical protein
MPYAKGREEEGYAIDERSLDSMIDSMADMNSRMPMVKQIRGPYDAPQMWRDDIMGMANLMKKPDFVAYMGTIGCRNTWGMVKMLVQDLEKAGYPTWFYTEMDLTTGCSLWESIAVKIDEFTH